MTLQLEMFLVLISDVTRGLSQGGKLSWRGPTGHRRGPL